MSLAITSTTTSIAGAAEEAAQGRAQRRALTRQRQAQADELKGQADTQLEDRIGTARRERARARVTAVEGGVGGQSFGLQLRSRQQTPRRCQRVGLLGPTYRRTNPTSRNRHMNRSGIPHMRPRRGWLNSLGQPHSPLS